MRKKPFIQSSEAYATLQIKLHQKPIFLKFRSLIDRCKNTLQTIENALKFPKGPAGRKYHGIYYFNPLPMTVSPVQVNGPMTVRSTPIYPTADADIGPAPTSGRYHPISISR